MGVQTAARGGVGLLGVFVTAEVRDDPPTSHPTGSDRGFPLSPFNIISHKARCGAPPNTCLTRISVCAHSWLGIPPAGGAPGASISETESRRNDISRSHQPRGAGYGTTCRARGRTPTRSQLVSAPEMYRGPGPAATCAAPRCGIALPAGRTSTQAGPRARVCACAEKCGQIAV